MEVALREKAAELESALARQKTELEEKYMIRLNAITEEEVGKLAANYKAQLLGIRD